MAGLAELESEKARRERAKKAVESREWHPVKKPILSDGAVDKIAPPKPKTDTRQAAAKSAGVSERKVRQAQEAGEGMGTECTRTFPSPWDGANWHQL